MKTLKDYKAIIDNLEPECDCGTPLLPVDLEHYDHDGGWYVEGFDEKQWLYLECPDCGYQTALWKIGITRPDGEVKT